MGVGDAVDVGRHGWVFEEVVDEENGGRESVRVVAEDELGKLYHGDYVSHTWGCIEDDLLLHTFLVFLLRNMKFFFSYLSKKKKFFFSFGGGGI